MTMIDNDFLFTLLRPKGRIAEKKLCECSSKTVNITIYTQYKKLKHKIIDRPKITAGLSIKLSIDMGWLILTETAGHKRLVHFVTVCVSVCVCVCVCV